MKSLHIASALSLALLLTACGGQQDFQGSTLASTTVSASTIVASSASPAVATAPATTAVAANLPQPDCAAEGCAGLRIIDGNAETWRIDAARRAALDARI